MNSNSQQFDSIDKNNSSAIGVGFYGKHFRKILVAILLLAPAYLWMSGKVLTPGDMSAYLLDVSHWLPQNNQLIRDMEKFSEVAGMERSNVVRISWPNCTEDDPRLYQLEKKLKVLTWGETYSPEKPDLLIFDQVVTIKNFVAKLKSDGVKLSDEQIYRQLKNVLIGDDGTTCLLSILPTREPAKRMFAIEEVKRLGATVDGLDVDEIRLFGGPVYTAKIDQLGAEIIAKFTPLSVLISTLFAWLCLRKILVMLAVLLNAIIATCFGLVSMYLTDAAMDPLLMMIPGFWFIMGTSAGLHFINYYFEEQAKPGVEGDLATITVGVAFRPAFLATLTTCIGLSSLCTSEIMPLWRFGFHSSIGLACGFVAMFLFLPSFLTLLSGRIKPKSSDPQKRDYFHTFWIWYENFVTKFGPKTTAVFMALILFGAFGFGNLNFSNKLKNQFKASSPINTDTNWFEEQIGPVIPFELLIRFPKENLPRPSACLRYVASMQERIDQTTIPTKTLSATAIIPFESGSGARQGIMRTILDKKIDKRRDSLARTGYVIDEGEYEMWRMTVFVYNKAEENLSHHFHVIEDAIVAHQADYKFSDDDSKNVDVLVSFAGLGSRMAVITSKLGGGLLQSCFVSVVLISLVVIVALRSFSLGLTAMLPNVFPIVISFGFFGYFQPTLDIGSIMTASIAMGIAVDDTIHFMYWFRQGRILNLPRVDAVKMAIRKSGRAILATSLICGFGFLVYFFCDFMPVARFGQLLFFMLTAALVGDLFFLPALLQSMPARLLGFKSDSTDKPETQND